MIIDVEQARRHPSVLEGGGYSAAGWAARRSGVRSSDAIDRLARLPY